MKLGGKHELGESEALEVGELGVNVIKIYYMHV